MTLPFLRTVRRQAFVVLMLVVATSQLIGMAIYSADRQTILTAGEALDVAERTLELVDQLRLVPGHWREDVVRAASTDSFRVALGPRTPANSLAVDKRLTAEVKQFLADRLDGWDDAWIVVSSYRPDAFGSEWMVDAESLLRIAVRLERGLWLTVTGVIPRTEQLWPRPAGLYLLSVLVGMVIVGIWLVDRVTAPLTTFASAADRLGKNLRSQPLAESGPEEVAKAAKAFNEMQSRLQRMVENQTEMLAAISHDLRTRVTLLSLRAELLTDGAERDKVIATLEEMDSMIGSLLDFARGTFQDEPNRLVDLSALLESLCEDLADTGASVALTAPAKVLYRCRRIALKRAITNLLDNALKYAGSADIVLSDEAAEVSIRILDRGPGFDCDELDDLFVPFFRAQWSRSHAAGVGLGLSIAQAIVHRHGGRLQIGNRPGGGADVDIRLPK
ncbi:MAG: ATP-binding protein [Pseudomonadales bacterium]